MPAPLPVTKPSPKSSSSKPVPVPVPVPAPAPAPVPQYDGIVPPPPYIPFNLLGPLTNQCEFSTPFLCSTAPQGYAQPAWSTSSPAAISGSLQIGDAFQWLQSGHLPIERMEASYNFSGMPY